MGQRTGERACINAQAQVLLDVLVRPISGAGGTAAQSHWPVVMGGGVMKLGS